MSTRVIKVPGNPDKPVWLVVKNKVRAELPRPGSPLTSLSHSSLGGCSSGDMIPPTLLRTPWPLRVMRVACSSARWSIHITTFLCLSPAGIGVKETQMIGFLVKNFILKQ